MRNRVKWALCLTVCFVAFSFLALPAVAADPWVDKGSDEKQQGDPMNPHINSMYYGMPMMLDGEPWADGPPKTGKPGFEASPVVGPSAWWMQQALDEFPWADDPPRKNSPKE